MSATPLLDSSSAKLTVVSIPSARLMREYYTPHENYDPTPEDILGDMIWGEKVDLGHIFIYGGNIRTGLNRRGYTDYFFDAYEYTTQEILTWVAEQPELAPYLGTKNPYTR